MTAIMIDVLGSFDHVRNTATQGEDAKDGRPGAARFVSPFKNLELSCHVASPKKASRGTAYCVVPPASYSVRVSWRLPHLGQSTGAGESLRPCNGTAV